MLACVPLAAWLAVGLIPGLPYAVAWVLMLAGMLGFPVAVAVSIGAIVMAPRGRGWISLAILAAIAGCVYLIFTSGDFGR